MSAGPKAAAFAVFLRIFMTAFLPIASRWEPFVWSSALLTMIIGNFAALTQPNIKRLLAYSSIAHAGYVMVAIAAHIRSESRRDVLPGRLRVDEHRRIRRGDALLAARAKNTSTSTISRASAGDSRSPPALFTIFLLSLIGVPLTGGFFGKFYIFKAALDANLVWLAVLGLLNSAVAAYYYLRILVVMYMEEPGPATVSVQPLSAGIRTTLWATALGTLILGIFPSVLLNFAQSSSALVK